jgi:RNA polymerase sigma-70 factor (ECF subfamily)
MSLDGPAQITALLSQWRRGNESAREELVTLVYPELKRIAGAYVRRERPGHTLNATGLVSEMYVRLIGTAAGDWQGRSHFFAAVARTMRHILVDHARAREAKKRPDERLRISLTDAGGVSAGGPEASIVELDDALTLLEAVDPRAGRVVELRYFMGLTEPEAAEAIGISIATLKRDWVFAKAYLFDQLTSAPSPR